MAAPAAAEFSAHFPYAGRERIQHFTVPAGVFWLTIDAEGGPGESGNDIAPAGHGGQITATVPVEPEQELDIYVGQYGFGSNGGWGWANGGHHGIIDGSGHDGGGGGGATAVLAPNGAPLVVAGGGGGGGGDAGGGLGGHWGGRGGSGGEPAQAGISARGGGSDGRGGCGGCRKEHSGDHGGDESSDGGGGGGGGGGYHGGHGGDDGASVSGGGGGGAGSSYSVPGSLAVSNGIGSGHDGDVVVSWGAAAAHATIVGGDDQQVPVGAAFAPLQVKMTTATGAPAADQVVLFQVPAEAPTGSFSNSSSVFETHTGPTGIATAGTLRAGGTTGRWAVKAWAPQTAAAVRFQLDNVAAATATAISSSSNPATVGEAVRFTAQVASASPEAGLEPTGVVQFWNGIVPLGAAVPLNAEGRAVSPPVAGLAVGSSAIRAEYLGDDGHQPSEATLQQEVVKAPTAVAVSSSANPAEVGEPIVFTARVAGHPGGGDPQPTGTVTFSVDGTAGAPVPLASGEAASLPVAALAEGAHEVTATYSGDADHAAAEGALRQSVGATATAVTVSSSASPSFFGEPTELQATVRRGGPGDVPSGRIVFRLGADPLCPAAELVAGTATCDLTAELEPGPHRIDVDFEGSGGYADSSGAIVQQVAAARTTTAVSVDPAAVPFGQESWLRANVATLAPGSGLPRGSVQFFVDGEAVGDPVEVSEGSAAILPICSLLNPVCSLAPGAHRVEAEFSGGASPRYGASRGASATRVTDAQTTTTLSSDAGQPAAYGAPVSFTARVTAPAGTGGAAGGVEFAVDGKPLGDLVALRHGEASSAPVALPPGRHEVSAGYQGSNGFTASAATLAQTVGSPPPVEPGDGGSGSGTGAPAGAGRGPLARLRTSHARVDRWGQARVRVSCRGPAGSSCEGRLAVRGPAHRHLAHRRYAIAAGHTRPVAIELNGGGRHLLSRHRHLQTRVELVGGGGVSHRRLTLRPSRAPAVALASGPSVSARGGLVSLRLRCRAARGGRCHTSVLLASHGRRLGSWQRRLGRGSATLRLRLSAGAMAKLRRRGRLALRAAAISGLPVGRSSVDRRRLVVRER